MLGASISGMDEIIAKLQQIQQRGGNLRPLLLEIGEDLTESTKQRFITTTAPDGEKWLLNSVLSTLLYKEGDTPLTDEGHLAASIHYAMLGNDGVEIGTNAVQGAMMQFGGTKAEFPQLWGDVPARPYLGLSEQDKQAILELIADYLL
jgi:phage virion morphogenesis protein